MLGRKQFVIEVVHPNSGNVSKKSLSEKLAQTYKVNDSNCVQVFGMKTAFGGGRSTGFALMYDNLAAVKKFEPKHRLKRVGMDVKAKTGRRNRKDLRHRQAKLRGKAKGKAAAS